MARRCEKKCLEKSKIPIIPEGMIYGEPQNPKALYPNMTFCVAKKHKQDGEYIQAGNWACRQNSNGDTLGNQYCSGNQSFPGYGKNVPDINHITFKRMYKYLRKVIGVENITVWNGEKPVSIYDYLIANGTNLLEYNEMINKEDIYLYYD
jgi:hypothetical protein